MSESTPSSGRSGGRRRALIGGGVALLVVLAVVAYAVVRVAGPDQTTGSARGPATGGRASPTRLSSLDLSRLPVQRRSLCDRIARSDVAAALRGPVTETDHYSNGDRTSLTATVRDVAHEYDCTYRGATGAEARVWVFAAPVTIPDSRILVRDARTATGCVLVRGGPRFGSPDVSTRCRVATPPGTAVSLRGLFGDAWLSCELSTPDAAATGDPVDVTVRRSQRWCVDVATSVGAR